MFKEGGWNWFKRDKTDEGEKTKRIPGGGDGVNLEQHPFADEKAEQQSYPADRIILFSWYCHWWLQLKQGRRHRQCHHRQHTGKQ